jgi:hypothetical protein
LEVLRGLRAQELDTRADDSELRSWDADCPVCRPLSEGLWPMRVTETVPDGPARVRCISGCDEQAILAAITPNHGEAPVGVVSVPAATPLGRRPTLRRLDVERMLATVPAPVPWIAEPLLAHGAVTMLVGREGQGKSMLALALAAAIGHGRSVAGIACRPGRVLVVDAENGEAETHRRVRGLGVKPGTLVYAEADGFDLRADLCDVEALLGEHRPDVLVLDSLRSLAPGLEENDSGPVEAVLGPLRGLSRRHQCATLVLHHAGKASNSYRGSTAIGAAVELGFTLAREGEDPHRRTLTCWKSRLAPEPAPRSLILDTHDGRVTIEAAEPSTASATGPTGLEARFAEILAQRGELQRGELCEIAGVNPNDGNTTRTLQRAVAAGHILNPGRGLYAIAAAVGHSSLPPSAIGGEAGGMNPAAHQEQAA